MTTVVTAAPEVGATGGLHPRRSSGSSSRIAFGALLLRDLVVLKKRLREFIPRTIVQPFLLCFVFLYVFPTIGQGVGGGGGAAGESAFATILVAGVVGLSVMFQGIQAVALPMVQEFGYTKEIEDRVLAPLPVSLVALEKVMFGAIQGLIAAAIVFPIAAVVHAGGVHIDLQVQWLQLVTLIPLACITTSALGLTFGTIFDPRTVPLLFGIIILPITFLGGTYYAWTTLAPVTIGSFHWLQVLVLVNPLIYINEGMRGALTSAPHMSLWIVYPVLLGFCALFLWVGTRNFRKRVIS
jgi:ABC-2 type transport system permease protein